MHCDPHGVKPEAHSVEQMLFLQVNPPVQSLSEQQLPPLFHAPEQHRPVPVW